MSPKRKSPKHKSPRRSASPKRPMTYREFVRAYAKANAPLPANWMRDAATEWKSFRGGNIFAQYYQSRGGGIDYLRRKMAAMNAAKTGQRPI